MSILNTSKNGSSASRVTRHSSRIDFVFKGKWLIHYDPAEFTYTEILTLLPPLQTQLENLKVNYKFLNITFNRNVRRNRFFLVGDNLFIKHDGSDGKLAESDPGAFAVLSTIKPLAKPIRSVNLFFPRLESDPRWKTMGLPAAQLFLASGLQANGFPVSVLPLSLPASAPPPGALSTDMAGFTLFEDLLPALRPFLADFKGSYGGFLAAGGPFPTLAPMAAIMHLPIFNLFVRGEAEIGFPLILDALNQGDIDALFRGKGFLWQQPGLIVISDFDKVSRPETFSRFKVDLSFLRPEHLRQGLEMNFSRGCSRGCLFCCRAQGSKFRKLPLEKAEKLLEEYKNKVERSTHASKSPRPLSGPPPLAKGVDETKPSNQTKRGLMNQTPATGNFSSCPPLLKGGDRGDFFISESDSTPPAASQSPRQEPPPLANGVFQGNIEMAHAININDDDILQDPVYAASIFALVKSHGFRIIGIQTSPASLIQSGGSVNYSVLDLAADPGLYLDGRPLLWLGSDVFLPQRARRLGKCLPSPEGFAKLLAEFEKRGLRHFHYWISSDGDSTWEEFSEELALICNYYRNFPNFGLLAHAPFIVPYPASRLFARLGDNAANLKVKLQLNAPDPRFSYQVVERLETKWPQLNNLLKNEKAGGEFGFFDLLKLKDFAAAAQLAYHYLKQEQLQGVANEPGLIKAQEQLEKLIGELLELRDA